MRFGYLAVLIVCTVCADVFADAPNTQNISCNQDSSMADITICSKQDLNKAEANLKKIYQEALAKIDADFPASSDKDYNDGYKKALKASQDAWVKFRNVDCDFSNYDRTGGSSQLMNIYGCKADMTNARAKELEGLIKDDTL